MTDDLRARITAERDQLAAAVERVRIIHHRVECSNVRCTEGGWCIGCDPEGADGCSESPWPCPTVLAVSPDGEVPTLYAKWVLKRDHDAMTAERDRLAARVAELEQHQADDHAEINQTTGQLNAVHATAIEWSAHCPPDNQGMHPTDMILANAGRYLLALIDQPECIPAATVTNHTYEGTPGPRQSCQAKTFGETCGAPREQHELRDEP